MLTQLSVLLMVALSLSNSHPTASQLTAADRRRLAAVVQTARDRGDIPGVALSIVNTSSVLVEEGFGVANVSSGRPMTADTLLPIGSTTKAFTSALLALLIDKHHGAKLVSLCVRRFSRKRLTCFCRVCFKFPSGYRPTWLYQP